MMQQLLLIFLAWVATVNSVTTDEATTLCDFVAATDISKYHPKWACTNGVPLTQPCVDWTGVICNTNNSVHGFEIWGYEGAVSGTLPASLGNLYALSSIIISDTKLSGTIPQSFEKLSNLKSIELSNNLLSGLLPVSISTYTSLTGIVIANNKFTGTIPSGYGNLANLQHLSLYGNQLTGVIPDSLGNLSALQNVVLTNNLLSGTVPSSLCHFKAQFFEMYLTNGDEGTKDDNPNIKCYPSCLRDAYQNNLHAEGLTVC